MGAQRKTTIIDHDTRWYIINALRWALEQKNSGYTHSQKLELERLANLIEDNYDIVLRSC